MPGPIGRKLNQRWGINARHALYDKDGKWYHQLTSFPGALCDPNGYVLFRTAEDFESCKKLQIRKDVNVDGHISEITGYVRVPDELVYRGQ